MLSALPSNRKICSWQDEFEEKGNRNAEKTIKLGPFQDHHTLPKEERKKKKKALLVGETTSTSQGCTSKSDKGQETTTTVSAAGCTVTIEYIEQGDESKKTQKTDDESE